MENLTQTYAVHVIQSLLSPGMELEYMEVPVRHPAVMIVDLDGDGVPEIVGGYRTQEGIHALIAKYAYDRWHVVSRMKGPGYAIANMIAAPIVMQNRNSLLLGWQIGAAWAQLDVVHFEQGTYRHLTPYDVIYSKIMVEDMPGPQGNDGLCEIALWVHDAGEAYKIDIYRWNRGMAKDASVYPYYFAKKVVPYYERLVNEMPDSSIYRQYLQEAKEKAMR